VGVMQLTYEQHDLFSALPAPPPASRLSDPATSSKGAQAVRPRTGSQVHRLLVAYGSDTARMQDGLTDDQAATLAGLAQLRSCCWWKRCSDLRAWGFIAPTGEQRMSADTGEWRIACHITAEGRAQLARLGVTLK
jgi:hypothetical protein